jgi:hypothetical protein
MLFPHADKTPFSLRVMENRIRFQFGLADIYSAVDSPHVPR